MKADANVALKEAGLEYKGQAQARHMVEVLLEDIGMEALQSGVKKPLKSIKFAGYVGCQTNRPSASSASPSRIPCTSTT